ncbi:exopolyphosphatase / guanosine-5'-triphosphate,3'-diphosphate pyrophosphatase [Lachnospiraceae bacterium NK3A20]|nr:exopolyphosphatase / guanosine-5'-triphosphate,3'-diphosphate pyrophosphatase [Lachnospiraceae bacterium NK3A20]
MAIHVFGAIDVGSYELGLKIFEISRSKGIRLVDHMERRIDLGSDTYATGKISYFHIQQAGQVLAEFRKVMDNYRVEAYRAYGTSAIREMTNASLVLEQWEQQSGIHIDVISNSEQRFLDYKSIASKGEEFNRFIKDTCAIVDIGGGSIQISLFNEDKLSATQNMPLGILRLYDQISHIDMRTSQVESIVEELVGAQINTFVKLYLGDRKIHNIIVVDDYLSSVAEAMQTEYVNADKLSDIVRSAGRLGAANVARRLGIMDDSYNLVYLSGIMVNYIMQRFGAEKLWVPGVTLCDGMVYEYAENHKIIPPSHDFEGDIISCAVNVSKRYQGSEERERTLEKIAVAVFDATKKIHGLGKREKLLLRLSATLHDCGKYISMSNLADCSYNIIMSTEIIGLSHIEREIVANVVRFNHSDFVYYEEQNMASDIDRESYLTIAKLTAILRIVNGLDRSHKQKFGDIHITVKGDKMLISVKPGVDITLEKGMISRRAEFFEEVFGLTPVIKQRKS